MAAAREFSGVSRARDEKQQVFSLSMDGGEATPLTSLKNGVSDFVWSPDGMQLAVVSRRPDQQFRREALLLAVL